METEGYTHEWLQDEIWKLLHETNAIEEQKRIHELAKLCKHLDGVTVTSIKATLKAFRATAKAEAKVEAAEKMAPHLAAFNEQYFLWRNGSKIRIGELMPRQLNGHSFVDIVGYAPHEWRVACANQIHGGDQISEMWLTSPDRREMIGSTIDPKAPPLTIVNKRMNLWQGFSVTPAPGPYQWFTMHLVRLVGPRYGAYILCWIAKAFQKPERPIGTAIMLVGREGTGKGMLGNLLRSIWGPHGQTIYTPYALTGKHNAHLRNCCFAFLDEPPWAGDKGGVDILKHMITEPTLRIEPKNIDSEEIDNRIKIIAATNHQWAAHISPTDRRFAVFEVSEELHEDRPYFDAFVACAEDPAHKAALLHYLLNLDVSGFDPERDRPITRIYAQQKAASLTGDWLFWRQVTEQNDFNIGRGWKDNHPMLEIPHGEWPGQTDIYRRYAAWHESVGRGSPVIPNVFWKNFHRWAGEINTRRDQWMVKERQIRIDLPPLNTLGERLRAFLGEEINSEEV